MGALVLFLSRIPPKVWGYLALLLAIAYVILRFELWAEARGEAKIQTKWDAVVAAQKAADMKEGARQQVGVEKVVIQYVERIKYITGQIHVTTEDIPHPPDNDGCKLDPSYRVSHDSAATGATPGNITGAIKAATAVEASTYTRTVEENYGICRTNAAQLEALQEAVRVIFPNLTTDEVTK